MTGYFLEVILGIIIQIPKVRIMSIDIPKILQTSVKSSFDIFQRYIMATFLHPGCNSFGTKVNIGYKYKNIAAEPAWQEVSWM